MGIVVGGNRTGDGGGGAETDPNAILKSLIDQRGDLIAGDGDNLPVRVPTAGSGKFLTANAGANGGLEWITHGGAGSDPHGQYVREDEFTAKGDLLVGTDDSMLLALPVGSDGYVLTADSGEDSGLIWTPSSGGGGGAGASFGVYADLPDPGSSGAMYFCTDVPVILVDNGLAWQYWTHGQPCSLIDQPTTPYNQSTNTITDRGWCMDMICPDTGSPGVPSMRGLEKNLPVTPYTVDIGLTVISYNRTYPSWGLMLRDSNSGKFITVGPAFNGMFIQKINADNSWNSNYETAEMLHQPPIPFWIRVHDDGTNIQFFFGHNRENMINFRTTLDRDEWLANPDRIGWFVNNTTNFFPIRAQLVAWYEY